MAHARPTRRLQKGVLRHLSRENAEYASPLTRGPSLCSLKRVALAAMTWGSGHQERLQIAEPREV